MMIRFLLSAVIVTLTDSAYALTNEAFSLQVERQVRNFEMDGAALRGAEKFCMSLPDRRRQTEVRCVAIQKVVSKEIRAGRFEKSSGKTW